VIFIKPLLSVSILGGALLVAGCNSAPTPATQVAGDTSKPDAPNANTSAKAVDHPDVLPCLELWRGHKLGVLTNGDPEQQRGKVERFGLTQQFQVVVVLGKNGPHKHLSWRRNEQKFTRLSALPQPVE